MSSFVFHSKILSKPNNFHSRLLFCTHLLRFSFKLDNKKTKPTITTLRFSDYLRRARLIDSLRLRLRRCPSIPGDLDLPLTLDSFAAAALIRSTPSADSALALFHSLPPASFSHPAPLHALARRLAISRRLPYLQTLIESHRFSLSDKLRFLSAAGDLSGSLNLFNSLRTAARPSTEAYNLVLSLHASAADHPATVSLFLQLINDGALPNSRTYTIIIEHMISVGKLDEGMKVFDILPKMRIKRTTKQYNVIAEALASSRKFDDLQNLIREMSSDGLLPGRSVRSAMISMRANGSTEGIEEYLNELEPDKRIGYAVGAEEESGSEDDEEGEEEIKLKPWLDPAAMARALEGWNTRDVADLEAAGFVWTSRLVCKLLRVFKNPETAWKFFCWVAYQPGGFAHDKHTVSRMIAVLARAGHVDLVDQLLAKVRSEGILLPFSTVRLIIDFYGLSKQSDPAMKVFRKANSICSSISPSNKSLLCSSMLRTMTKCKKGGEAMELLEDMLLNGVQLDLQTYSGMIQYFADEGDLKTVHGLFGMVKQSGLEPDAYMYHLLIQAYCKHDRAALGLRMFDEMMSFKMVPDVATVNLLVKSLWNEGKLREAALVQEKCEEINGDLPAVLPGSLWTVSSADFQKVLQIYSGCFEQQQCYSYQNLSQKAFTK